MKLASQWPDSVNAQEILQAEDGGRVKGCSGCLGLFPLDRFGKAAGSSSGYKSRCTKCSARSTAKWRERNPRPKVNRTVPKCHPDQRHHAKGLCKKCYEEMHRHKYRERKQLRRACREYGLTEAVVLRLQDRKTCQICGRRKEDEQHGVLSIDHCHETGEVRGMLCKKCNIGLGHFEDKPKLLMAAAIYLLEE